MDNSDPDNFVIYGNALPELEEEEASAKKMKPVPVEEQVATDDQGRRRFHGAFTGGFSAGFFNTAGSRDGWAPKHFKSSKQSRFESDSRPQQKPEDFMDDEDMGNAFFVTIKSLMFLKCLHKYSDVIFQVILALHPKNYKLQINFGKTIKKQTRIKENMSLKAWEGTLVPFQGIQYWIN